MVSYTRESNNPNSIAGDRLATPFTMCSDEIYSQPSDITEPAIVIAMGLHPLDKIYLHYGQHMGRCKAVEDSRIKICGCEMKLDCKNNVMPLPWSGSWQLEYAGAESALVVIRKLHVSWDSALDMFMQMAKCCTANGPQQDGDCEAECVPCR